LLVTDEYVERRAGALRDAIRKHGGAKTAELPVVLIENSSRAPTSPEGEKLLGNKRPWLPDLMRKVWLLATAAIIAVQCLCFVGMSSPKHVISKSWASCQLAR
jgi:hypothetical protein